MKIGYPCINLHLGCRSSSTFRLKSYSAELLREKVAGNLDCLLKILRFNVAHRILFFRISSDLIPFASHPVCRVDWKRAFRNEFNALGAFIKKHRIRISMHPDQFTLINSIDPAVFRRSVKELRYHADVLDAMGLNLSAKIQIHVGGVYGDREKSIARFVQRFRALPANVRRRLVIENDDVNYPVADCLEISHRIGLPVLFDVFHHTLNNRGEAIRDILPLIAHTWGKRDGIMMVDYSSQERGKRRRTHARTIDLKDFDRFLSLSRPIDFDCMLEIKDKEGSALKAVAAARRDNRFSNKTRNTKL
ncbi:MAG: UV DNA damage repair endonuclease UvsE [bacterium]